MDYGTETLTATGGDGSYSWALASGSGPLPTGLTLAANGDITGTPTVVGTQSFMVQVASGDGQTAQQTLSISVGMILQPSELCSDHFEHDIATFEDAFLGPAVGAEIFGGYGWQNNPEENLTCGLVSMLTDWNNYTGGRFAEITSLAGIQNLTSLTELKFHHGSFSDMSPLSGLTSLSRLHFNYNSISDISALSGLTGLTDLQLEGNSITDISVLSGLTNLTVFILDDNSISDIGALSGLKSLTVLFLDNNSIIDISALSELTSLTDLQLRSNTISDISALSGLTSLTFLALNDNSITDIGVLSGLTSLTTLSLSNNLNLTDIQPLLDNPGLNGDNPGPGPGFPFADRVNLVNTNVSCTDVAALQAKGVIVRSDCP